MRYQFIINANRQIIDKSLALYFSLETTQLLPFEQSTMIRCRCGTIVLSVFTFFFYLMSIVSAGDV